ncbi:MAG: SPOR domain-containing protein [Bacteroidales bacterium]|nr:SPOR domain-containing protein [Bacteroidales bacterium]
MDITPFIRELLFGHDCVIVPGFGGFLGNYTPARIDRNTGTFYPPVKQISFNSNLNHNDGLLVGRISESLKLNYGDARNIAEEFASALHKKLERGEKVVFDNIGTFINNQEGNVQFEPARDVNYHLDSYGLESFKFMPLEGYDVRKRIARHIDKEPVRHSSFRKVLWRAAVIIPLLTILAVVWLKTDISKSRIESTTMNPLVTAEFESNKKAVDENIAAGEAKKEEIFIPASDNSAVAETPPVPETIPPVTPREDIYLLITGSFKSEENALGWADMLKKEGFSPEILNSPNGFYRVSAMRCNTLATAVNMKKSISIKFPGTWYKKIN